MLETGKFFSFSFFEKLLFTIAIGLVILALNFVVSYLFSIGNFLAVPLATVSVAPLYLLLFILGLPSALIAMVISIIGCLVAKGLLFTIIQLVLFWLPAVITAIFISLYSLLDKNGYYTQFGDILFSTILCNILSVVVFCFIANYFPILEENIKQNLLSKIAILSEMEAPASYADLWGEKLATLNNFILNNFLLIFSCSALIYSISFMLTNFYFGIKLCINTGVNIGKYQRYSWNKDLRLPIAALISYLFVFLLLSSRILPQLDLLFSLAFVAFTLLFIFCGLSYFHQITNFIMGRTILLFICYLILFFGGFLSMPLILTFWLMGLWSSISYYKRTKHII